MELHAFVSNSRSVQPTRAGGPLSGISLAVKDLFALRGHVSSFGHGVWRDTHEPAAEDAAVLAKALAGGADVAGLAKLDQLAYSLIGDVGEGPAPVNPFRPRAFCGGSSSGSASAVAGGVATVGVGTDTAGSIRIPAAVCGLYGLRPTHGTIDPAGAIPLAPSMDVVGLCAASLTPMQALYRQIAAGADTEPVEVRRVLVAVGLDPALTSGATDEVLTGIGAAIADHIGAPVTHLPAGAFTSADVADLLARVQGREIWATHGAWLERHGGHLAPDVRRRVERSRTLSHGDGDGRAADLRRRRIYAERLSDLLGPDGVLVLPAKPEADPGRDWTQSQLAAFRAACVRLTAASSLSGLPQLVLRLPQSLARESVTAAGLVGPPGSDMTLMDLARHLDDG